MHLTFFKRIIFLGIILIISSICIYDKYYKIDFTQFHSVSFVAAADSPDKNHAVGVTVYQIAPDDSVAYIRGVVYDLTDPQKREKTILWSKVDSNTIKISNTELTPPKYSVTAVWLDNHTIVINDHSLDINKTYDYRRK